MKTNLRLVKVNTTAYEEENFFLITDLTDYQIIAAITPIVLKERNGKEEYNNEILCEKLRETYPKNIIIGYNNENIDKISI